MSRKAWDGIVNVFVGRGSDVWKKLTNPTVRRGGTQWPKSSGDQEAHGVRLDYDGDIEENGQIYHRYQVQPNAGKIPSTWKAWRDKNGGTHAVIGIVKVKKGATKRDVEDALNNFEADF
ncbi:hypothetical protein FQN54_005368 [Arachnomyces sp. PD_36]|nr:hypothetical protein FQN54_005368 [Arachnomyces sp. PD_36]